MNAVAIVDEVVPEVFTQKRGVGRPLGGDQPFGITAKPGSKLYHRLYSRMHKRQRSEDRKAEQASRTRASSTPTLEQHVTLREISLQQGWPVDRTSLCRLKRRLLARQKLAGVVFMVKLGVSGNNGPQSRYYTTLALLRRHASELFSEPAEGLDQVKDFVTRVSQEMADLRAQVKKLRHRVKALEAALAQKAAA
jgi:hypothetical protein